MKYRTVMFPTFPEDLPNGYPLPTETATELFAPVWDLAFRLHNVSHSFKLGVFRYRYKLIDGGEKIYRHEGPRPGIINPIMFKEHYCDCFKRARIKILGS